MKITRNSTLQITTATLSPMLMPAFFFCEGPLVVSATMARMRAGMVQLRQTREVPQQSSVKIEKIKAHIAIPEWSSVGGDTTVVVAAVGCAATTTVVLVAVVVDCGW